MKVVITGPESTGKSTLCARLAEHYQTGYVPEYAREYLNKLDREYSESDLLKIAEGQIKLEDDSRKQENNILICDTSLEVIRVWSEWKYGRCNSFILEQAKVRVPNLFLLMTPDLPWQPDPLRENPNDRQELFDYYKNLLADYKVKVVEVYGNENSRSLIAIDAIDKILQNN